MKKVVRIPITEKPITPEMVIPLAALQMLRNESEVVQELLVDITGGVVFEDVVIDVKTYNFPLKPILEKMAKGSK